MHRFLPIHELVVITEHCCEYIVFGCAGEVVGGWQMSPVVRGQFTPLGPALLWVLLQEGGRDVSLGRVRSALASHFPLMALPDAVTTHTALRDLIRQRRVYNTGSGYCLVTAQSYKNGEYTLRQ